jgi:hypothetical protein
MAKSWHEKPASSYRRKGDEIRESNLRNIVTSENREQFMKKKLNLADKEQEVLDDSHGIEKHDPKISTEYKLTDFPATADKLSYQSPSTDDERKFDNHKIFQGATHLYTVGKEAIDSDKYISKHKKTGDIDNFPSKEHAFKHIAKKHKRK